MPSLRIIVAINSVNRGIRLRPDSSFVSRFVELTSEVPTLKTHSLQLIQFPRRLQVGSGRVQFVNLRHKVANCRRVWLRRLGMGHQQAQADYEAAAT